MENGLALYFLLRTRNSSSFLRDLHMDSLYFLIMRSLFTNALIFYHPNDEGGLIWNDPDIGVEWPIPEGMELSFSDKDTKWGSFKEYRK